MNIGKALKKARKDAGLSQIALSVLSGISQTSISQLELDKTYPHQSTLLKLCRSLKVSEMDIYNQAEQLNAKP